MSEVAGPADRPGEVNVIAMHLDRDAALARVGGDLELLQEIARLFLDDTDSMVEAIEQSAVVGDAKALERSAHTLKGCVSNFGAPAAFEAALSLEKMGRHGDFHGVTTGLVNLRAALEQLKPELEALAAE